MIDNNEPTREEEELIDLRQVLQTLDHYKWGIIGVASLVTLAAILIAYSMTPIYQSTVTLLIESKSNGPIPSQEVQDVYDPGVGRAEYFGTQFSIIKSRVL